jgi:hypothetical protein
MERSCEEVPTAPTARMLLCWNGTRLMEHRAQNWDRKTDTRCVFTFRRGMAMPNPPDGSSFVRINCCQNLVLISAPYPAKKQRWC